MITYNTNYCSIFHLRAFPTVTSPRGFPKCIIPLLSYPPWFNHPNSIKRAVVPTWSNKMYKRVVSEYIQPTNQPTEFHVTQKFLTGLPWSSTYSLTAMTESQQIVLTATFSLLSLSLSVSLFPVVMTRNSEMNSPRSNSASVRQFFRFHTNRNVHRSQNIRHDFVFTNWFMTIYPFAYYINQSFRSYIYIYAILCAGTFTILSVELSFSPFISPSIQFHSNWILYCNIIPQYFGYQNTAKLFKIRKSRVSQQTFATTCTWHDSIISEDWCDSRCQLYNSQCRWCIQLNCVSWSVHTVNVMCWHQDSRNTSKHSPGASLRKLEASIIITLSQ